MKLEQNKIYPYLYIAPILVLFAIYIVQIGRRGDNTSLIKTIGFIHQFIRGISNKTELNPIREQPVELF